METFRLLIGPDEGASVMQLCVRAVLLFAFGILCIRIAGRRTFAQYSPLDIVVALIVGSNIGRVMTGKGAFFPSLAATLVLVLLHRAVAFAALKWRWLAWLVKGTPVILIRDGVIQDKALPGRGMTRDDLIEGLRLEKVDRPEDVALATFERSGRISVVPKKRD